jgi:hypothetical protein
MRNLVLLKVERVAASAQNKSAFQSRLGSLLDVFLKCESSLFAHSPLYPRMVTAPISIPALGTQS